MMLLMIALLALGVFYGITHLMMLYARLKPAPAPSDEEKAEEKAKAVRLAEFRADMERIANEPIDPED